jgi:hypothetical protein
VYLMHVLVDPGFRIFRYVQQNAYMARRVSRKPRAVSWAMRVRETLRQKVMSIWGLENSVDNLLEDELKGDGRAEGEAGLDARSKGHVDSSAKRSQSTDRPEIEAPDESL